ncbi:MoxR family ATPase [Desemzia sp. RIT 804]|uniref:AAA family ATPase n=1 Tax=Desemzia sp. RIT 804 TaxID=2810209 RepID=UPI002103C520|nr:MoxR family ATPase [Desemzia sp. RIT 804]
MSLSEQHQQSIHKLHQLMDTVNQIVIGKQDVTKLTITAMLAGGHVLFEDIPGVGKTLLVKTIAKTLNAQFSRIQFTPDLVPSDIIGFSIPLSEKAQFEFRKGPIFSSLILADEINRTSPRTQAAMLEAMSEGHVTMDGKTYSLPKPFFVLATQNPIEHEGTYPLPEAQLDRFLMQLSLGYPTLEQEVQMLSNPNQNEALSRIEPLLDLDELQELKQLVPTIYVQPDLLTYIVKLGDSTRTNPLIRLGVSPRGNQYCLAAARAHALLDMRDYVIPDDILAVLPAVYQHRLLFKDYLSSKQKAVAIRALIQQVPVPVKRGHK